MQRVYQAANNVEAHMVLHMLEQSAVRAHVQGEHLQSGAGELPLGNLVAVAVADEDVAMAREVIRDWETRMAAPTDQGTTPSTQSSAGSYGVAFLAGALCAGALAWAAFSGPERSEGLDRDGDGTVDERLLFAGGRLVRSESDRNFDGRVDEILEYDGHGDLSAHRGDQDFDGRLESTTNYRAGQPRRWEVNRYGDERTDLRGRYEHGALQLLEYFDRASGQVVKKVTYRGDKPVRAEIDADRDGDFERSYRFDSIDEPVGE